MKNRGFIVIRLRYFILIYFSFIALLASCGRESVPSFAALGFSRAKILVANADATAPLNYTVTMYDEDGTYLGIIFDYTSSAGQPRGIAIIDPLNFLVSLENFDHIDKLNIFGQRTSGFAADTQLSGNLMDILSLPNGDFLIIEGNTIERFLANGQRYTTGATPYINTTIGACVLSVPRSMVLLANGQLAVTNTTNDRVNVYDVSTGTATCTSFNNTMGAVDPLPITKDSDGNVYVGMSLAATSTILRYNSTVVGAGTTIWSTNTAILSTPTAIAALPDNSLLIASDGTDAIIKISNSGSVINPTFIKNANTGAVLDIAVIPDR